MPDCSFIWIYLNSTAARIGSFFSAVFFFFIKERPRAPSLFLTGDTLEKLNYSRYKKHARLGDSLCLFCFFLCRLNCQDERTRWVCKCCARAGFFFKSFFSRPFKAFVSVSGVIFCKCLAREGTMSSLISTLVSFCFSSGVFLAWRSCFLFFYAASLACFPATLLLNRGFAAIASSLDKVYVSAVMIGSTFIFFSLPLFALFFGFSWIREVRSFKNWETDYHLVLAIGQAAIMNLDRSPQQHIKITCKLRRITRSCACLAFRNCH